MTSSSDFFIWYASTAQSGPSGLLRLKQHSHPTLAFKPLILFPPTLHILPLHPHYHLMLLDVSLYLLLPLHLPDFLRVLQWNGGGLQARSTELLHFISSHPVDLICIQESNLNLSSSFRIPGFSALRSDGTHSRSGIFSTDGIDASGGVIIFARQDLSFSMTRPSLDAFHPFGLIWTNVRFCFLVMTGQTLLMSPKGRNASRDGRVTLWEGAFILLVCEITTSFV